MTYCPSKRRIKDKKKEGEEGSKKKGRKGRARGKGESTGCWKKEKENNRREGKKDEPL